MVDIEDLIINLIVGIVATTITLIVCLGGISRECENFGKSKVGEWHLTCERIEK